MLRVESEYIAQHAEDIRIYEFIFLFVRCGER